MPWIRPTAWSPVRRRHLAHGDNFSPVTDTVLLFLNCNAKLASAGKPGNSLASPEGAAEKATEDQQAAQAAQQAAQQAASDQSQSTALLGGSNSG